MAEQLDDDELELLRKHREKKAKSRGRKVTVKGKHDSGAEYSFDIDGDEAERVIARHRALWDDEDEDQAGDGEEDGGDGEEGGTEPAKPRRRAAAGAAPVAQPSAERKPYFRK